MNVRSKFIFFSLSPGMIVFLCVTFVPTLILLSMLFTNMSLMTMQDISFIGFGNFIRLFKDTRFISTLKTTIIYVISTVSIELIVGTGLAIFMQKSPKLIRTAIMLPSMVAPVVVGLLWRILLNYEGPINTILGLLNLPLPLWLSSPRLALLTVILVDVWQWSPFVMLIIFAGIQRVDKEMLEAAEVDGASNLQIFWYILLPTILPVVMVALSIRLIDTMKTFDSIYILTRGGPGNVTEIISIYAYRTGIANGNIAYAATMAFLIFIISAYITRKLLARRVLQ